MHNLACRFFAFFVFGVSSAFAQDALRYPFSLAPQIRIEQTSNRDAYILQADEPYLVATFVEADSLDGPWVGTSVVVPNVGAHKFFRANINLSALRLNPYDVTSTVLFGIRVANPTNDVELTTQSGFRLRMQIRDWVYGVSIFHVDDGPSSGDLRSDYLRVKQELLADARTQFVTPVSGGGSCYLGGTDIFRINRGTITSEQLAKFNLEVIADEPNIVVARWTNAKSMELEQFDRILAADGIIGGHVATGCGL